MVQTSAPSGYTEFLSEILKESSDIARCYHGRVLPQVKISDNNQVLTEADVAIGRAILKELSDKYPTHNIIDEEAGIVERNSNYTWVVDPIDGTSNFAAGLPTYGIIIGLLHGGTPIAGGIALPAFSEIIIAQRASGAICNGKRLKVTPEQRLLSSLVAYGIDGYQNDPDQTRREVTQLADIILGIRNLRSSNSVYDIACVAKGQYGAYLNRTSKIWDNVGPQIIIEEAGGLYTGFDGSPLDYASPLARVGKNFQVCAGAPQLHSSLQRIIHRQQ